MIQSHKWIIACSILLTMISCNKEAKKTIRVNVPVYMSYETFREGDLIQTDGIRTLGNTGKIYFKDNYIFINDKFNGVHVVDNADPSNPDNAYYISIPGNTDISIKGDKLYANSFMDLVVIDISNTNC